MVTTAIISATSSGFGMENSPTADKFKRDVQKRMSTQHETPEQAIEYVLTNLYQDGRAQVVQSMQHDQSEIGQAFPEFMASQDLTAQSSSYAQKSLFKYRLEKIKKNDPKMSEQEAIITAWKTFDKNKRRAIKKSYLDEVDSAESKIIESLPVEEHVGLNSVNNQQFSKQTQTKKQQAFQFRPGDCGKIKNNYIVTDILKDGTSSKEEQQNLLWKSNKDSRNFLIKNYDHINKSNTITMQDIDTQIKKYLTDHNIMSKEYADTVNIPNYLFWEMQQSRHFYPIPSITPDKHRLK